MTTVRQAARRSMPAGSVADPSTRPLPGEVADPGGVTTRQSRRQSQRRRFREELAAVLVLVSVLVVVLIMLGMQWLDTGTPASSLSPTQGGSRVTSTGPTAAGPIAPGVQQ